MDWFKINVKKIVVGLLVALGINSSYKIDFLKYDAIDNLSITLYALGMFFLAYLIYYQKPRNSLGEINEKKTENEPPDSSLKGNSEDKG